MKFVRLAGQNVAFPFNRVELDVLGVRVDSTVQSFPLSEWHAPLEDDLVSRTVGFVGQQERQIEVWSTSSGFLVKVENIGDFLIVFDRQTIYINDTLVKERTSHDQVLLVSLLVREVILGPVLVLALAFRDIWSLHGSAVAHNGRTIAFLAESGTGKSTLAAYLSRQANWNLVADDILPVTGNSNGLTAWPHFPQLKLPLDAQPCINLPEHLPLNILCELVPVDTGVSPDLKRLSPEQAVKVLLGHTAGTRLFDAKMLEAHLGFCAQASEVVPVYQLMYPHSQNALPEIKSLLESLC